jgi:hypothetical protein
VARRRTGRSRQVRWLIQAKVRTRPKRQCPDPAPRRIAKRFRPSAAFCRRAQLNRYDIVHERPFQIPTDYQEWLIYRIAIIICDCDTGTPSLPGQSGLQNDRRDEASRPVSRPKRLCREQPVGENPTRRVIGAAPRRQESPQRRKCLSIPTPNRPIRPRRSHKRRQGSWPP